MLHDVVEVLACPHCGAPVALSGQSLWCARGHGFDVARQGYVNLMTPRGRTGTADTVEMVTSRERFLAAGHYAPLTRAIRRVAVDMAPRAAGCVVDIGAGPGHHLAEILQALPDWTGLALEVSKPAARRAARRHPRAGAAVCDVWHALPLQSASVGLILNVFAPRNGAEIARIMQPDGALLVVTPRGDHLHELVQAIGLMGVDPRKQERVEAELSPLLTCERREAVRFRMLLDTHDLEALVGMGPNAHHLTASAVRHRLRAIPTPMPVTAVVDIAVFRPAGQPSAMTTASAVAWTGKDSAIGPETHAETV